MTDSGSDRELAHALLERYDASRPDVVELATAVSLAVRVDPGLLRSARLALTRPRVGVGAEVDLWFSPLTASYTGRGLVLDTGVATLLRERLADDPELLARAGTLVRELHDKAAATIQLEEHLLYAALTRDDKEVAVLLEGAIAMMHADTERRRGVARWAARAVPTLPLNARESNAAQELVAGAERFLTAPIAVGVRLLHDGVEFSEPPAEGAHVLELPASRLWVEVRQVGGSGAGRIDIQREDVARHRVGVRSWSGATSVELRTGDGQVAVLARREDSPAHGATSDVLLTSYGPAWRLIERSKILSRSVNRVLINRAITVLPLARLSAKSAYVTQDSLADRTYNARLIEPAESESSTGAPDVDGVVDLFRRREFIPSEKSTVLFAYFAAWFTEGPLRSDRSVPDMDVRDITRNESTHEVDLSQLYGLRSDVTRMLRDPYNPMLLASQGEPGEELPPALYDDKGVRLKRFETLRTIGEKHDTVARSQLLAMGSDAGNTQIGFALFNTLFLREHNRLARELAEANPKWDEDRVFAAARSVLTALVVKLLLEELINHITPYHFHFRLDPRGFDRQPWMRPNWTTVEFNLLYRWHSLIPGELNVGSLTLPLRDTLFRSQELLRTQGLAGIVDSASRQPAGRIGLRNTDDVLLHMTERQSIQAGRMANLRGYNEYRQVCRLRPARSFAEITANPEVVARLQELYDSVDDVELYVGTFAEDTVPNGVLPPLLGRLVSATALRLLIANPVFEPAIYNEGTLSRRGLEIIDQTGSLADVVMRNIPAGAPSPLVTLTRQDWLRV